METPEGWMVVRVRPQLCARAIKHMERQGYECYAPRLVSGSSRRPKIQALFPGYVFVRHAGGRWLSLRGTYGVLDVLMSGFEKPASIAHSEIMLLRSREGRDGLIKLAPAPFSKGDHVRVEKGVMLGDAIMDGMSGEERAFVLMEVLGRSTRVEVPIADVVKRR